MKRHRLLWLLALAALGATAYAALRPRPVEADLAEAARGPFVVTVDESGETRVRELYAITAPLGGRLERIALEPGDFVEAGQVLAEIVPGEPALLDSRSEAELAARARAAEAAHEIARSRREIAEAEEEKALRYYQRDQRRLEQGGISAPMLEDAAHALRVARGSHAAARSAEEVARYELEQARAALTHTRSLTGEGGGAEDAGTGAVAGVDTDAGAARFTLRSPVEGYVLRRYQESSVPVAPGEPLLEVGDPRQLELRIDVLSQDAVRIRPGQRIRVEHWGGEGALEGWVRRVEPAAFTKVSALGVEEKRVWVYGDLVDRQATGEVRLEDPGELAPPAEQHAARLGDAYRVEARIVVYEKDGVLSVPAGALFREGAGEGASWAVFRLDAASRAELAHVVVGERNEVAAEVLEGLEEGDRVVLHPGDRVRPGALVRERHRSR